MGLFTIPEADIERGIRHIESVRTGESVDWVMQQLAPTLNSLRVGKNAGPQIEKLLRANQVDRAMTLLRVLPRTKAGPMRALRVMLPIFMVPLVGGMAFLMPRCDGGYEVAFDALHRCPAAVEALGPSIRQAPLGLACGSSRTGGGTGRSSWEFRVQGEKGAGTFRYAAANEGSGWRLGFGTVDVGDQSISIVPCGAATKDPLRGGKTFQAVVGSVSGNSAVRAGDSCTVDVSPTPEDARERGFNCQVRVTCGSNVVYGWDGTGITNCRVTDGVATHADDRQGATANDDPMLALDVAAKTCRVNDDGPRPFDVLLTLQ